MNKFKNTYIRTSHLNLNQLRALYKKYLFVLKGTSGNDLLTKAPYDLCWKYLVFKDGKLDFTDKYNVLIEITEEDLDNHLWVAIKGETYEQI